MPEKKINTAQKKFEKPTSSKSTAIENSKKETGSNSTTEKKAKAADTKKPDEKSPQKNERENHVRGENQKPVTRAYRNNWNNIFKNRIKK